MQETYTSCPGTSCDGDGDGFEEYGGMCPLCWVNLSLPSRAAILDARPQQFPPAPTTVEQHNHAHTHNYPLPPLWRRLVLMVLCGAIGGVAALAAAWVGLR